LYYIRTRRVDTYVYSVERRRPVHSWHRHIRRILTQTHTNMDIDRLNTSASTPTIYLSHYAVPHLQHSAIYMLTTPYRQLAVTQSVAHRSSPTVQQNSIIHCSRSLQNARPDIQ